MKFTYDGKNYRIGFQHDWDEATTFAFIKEDGDPRDAVIEGTSFCSAEDKFCYETGRKVALARALEDYAPDREFRKAAWAAYRSRKPQPRGITPEVKKALDHIRLYIAAIDGGADLDHEARYDDKDAVAFTVSHGLTTIVSLGDLREIAGYRP
jgi:hypothetical protein